MEGNQSKFGTQKMIELIVININDKSRGRFFFFNIK